MENLDVMVLRTLRDWRRAGKRALLTTVVRTWGSSPRPVGSIMALAEDGAVVGSVSGGCIEGAVVTEARQTIADGQTRLIDYGISDETAWQVGLACGGKCEVFIEPVE